MLTDLETELVGFKDRIRVSEGELAKNAPLIAQLSHSNQNMGNRVCALPASVVCDLLLWPQSLPSVVSRCITHVGTPRSCAKCMIVHCCNARHNGF